MTKADILQRITDVVDQSYRDLEHPPIPDGIKKGAIWYAENMISELHPPDVIEQSGFIDGVGHTTIQFEWHSGAVGSVQSTYVEIDSSTLANQYEVGSKGKVTHKAIKLGDT